MNYIKMMIIILQVNLKPILLLYRVKIFLNCFKYS
jgi:hypothetical protein